MLKRIAEFAKAWQTIISLIMAMGALVGGAFALDQTYARQEKLSMVEDRLDLKILQDQANFLEQRIWKTQDRYPDITKAPIEVKETLHERECQLDLLNKQIDLKLQKVEIAE